MRIESFIRRITGQEQRQLRLDQVRTEIEQRVAEHNAKTKLANIRYSEARTKLLLRSDWRDIMPIIDAFVFSERMSRDGLWANSIIEAEGNLLNAWDLIDEKVQSHRDKT